jgi:hypothetical protein
MRTDRQADWRAASETDRQADRQKDRETWRNWLAFREYANAPKNVKEDNYICRVTSCNLTYSADVSVEPATTFVGV